jgi:hypothetical protein
MDWLTTVTLAIFYPSNNSKIAILLNMPGYLVLYFASSVTLCYVAMLLDTLYWRGVGSFSAVFLFRSRLHVSPPTPPNTSWGEYDPAG